MPELKNIVKYYSDKCVFDGFSYKFETGKFTSLLGTSGCGKTTLLRLLSGLEKPDSGEVIIENNAKLSFIFQEHRLIPFCSVMKNLTAFGIERLKAEELLNDAGLIREADAYPEQLSGGMQRRLAIIRSLGFGGDIFFFDEPLRELDSDNRRKMIDLIRKYTKGKTVVAVTHEEAFAEELSDKIIVSDGLPFRIVSEK